ncbi:unnamed protein product [Rhizophagus irregularis]|nr:unnamed protein product [Rhizophagus irregularis]
MNMHKLMYYYQLTSHLIEKREERVTTSRHVSNPVGSRTNYKYLKILPHHNIEGKNMKSDYKGTRYIESRKLMFKLLSLELYVDQTIA